MKFVRFTPTYQSFSFYNFEHLKRRLFKKINLYILFYNINKNGTYIYRKRDGDIIVYNPMDIVQF